MEPSIPSPIILQHFFTPLSLEHFTIDVYFLVAFVEKVILPLTTFRQY
jgi:hypothetical protein